MKVLDFRELGEEDRLLFSFEATFDPGAPPESEMGPLFQALESHAGEWMPEIVEGERLRRYSRAAIWKAMGEFLDTRVTTIGFHREKWPGLSLTLRLFSSTLPPRLSVLSQVQPLSFFADEQRCHSFVEMVRDWAIRYPVTHAIAHSLADDQLAGAPDFGRDERLTRQNGFDRIYEVSWLNVFGPRLVEAVGRERMLSTPAHRVEALPNGSVLLVLWPTPADFASEPAREAQARAHAHLRPDLHAPTLLRSLLERSATLAPVEPHFPPDLAPLLLRVLDRAPIHERQRRIAEFNAWRPPEPEEWAPASQALPLDVDDPEPLLRALARHAEHLVVMLHSDVPSVFQQSPGSLTDIDFRLWLENWPATRERHVLDELVVPALGAYLGQLLVEHLGGRWLPRRDLDEAQVLVGSRVWFPLRRARCALRSRESLLDFSSTLLFRAAERHRADPAP